MSTKTVSLADAKTHLSKLTELVRHGETVIITKRGKPVVKVVQADSPRKPIQLEKLTALTDSMPKAKKEAGAFISEMRNSTRY